MGQRAERAFVELQRSVFRQQSLPEDSVYFWFHNQDGQYLKEPAVFLKVDFDEQADLTTSDGMICNKNCVYLLKRMSGPDKKAQESLIATSDVLECVLDFSHRIKDVVFAPFKPTDQKLTIYLSKGLHKELYFNTSAEMIAFFDFLLGSEVKIEGQSRTHKVFCRQSITQEASGWISIYSVA